MRMTHDELCSFQLSSACIYTVMFTCATVFTDVYGCRYVYSSYGARSLSAIYPLIDNYISCWGVSGIFVDEAPTGTRGSSRAYNIIPFIVSSYYCEYEYECR